jgi:HPt (histidine-containing phosphotransfer) domain-containing protein
MRMPSDPIEQAKNTQGPRESDARMAEALEEIDWSDLQEFFFEHLRGQLDQMRALFAHSDAPALARIGHSLKGSGGGVQLPRFTELGRDLEDAGTAGNLEAVLSACRAIRDEFLKHRPEEADTVGGLF